MIPSNDVRPFFSKVTAKITKNNEVMVLLLEKYRKDDGSEFVMRYYLQDDGSFMLLNEGAKQEKLSHVLIESVSGDPAYADD